ncbi:gll1941 [Gloeobacter violaceus PCC 7421]|uniref:Gll1941 protein n=2 Tax=Gloeobacter violaceus TaxID=33072 RepID=Q7NJ91_GLOVI|nr:gll1941 [Gloeobacter violaceus PCC 7421]
MAAGANGMDREPIAIVGMGCRFPGGVDSPGQFWQLLCDGADAISDLPPARWNLADLDTLEPGASEMKHARRGGFLEQVDRFDAEFFGISPREAVTIDPQQRLVLEVAWEALEDACQIPGRLAGTRTGVFVGLSSFDYYELLMADGRNFDAYLGTGNTNCVAANRLSYVLDLKGPSLAVDAACSSSLVAVHLACQSLWNGESDLCVAAGVHVMLSPRITMSFIKAGMMAADGRCKTFDARADGYVRSEGAGALILKPQSSALADGNRIYAVIRGSGTNHNGRSNGLTAPNPRAQESLLRQVWRQADVLPGQVQYVEAHGTGTALGDAMESKALGAVLCEGYPSGRSCLVGSVKTNIGHLEAAAGIAGIIKVALALHHRRIPPNLHFEQPNPHIPFERLPLQVVRELTPWEPGGELRLAGVSAFGFGGTNAHLLLQEAPPEPPAPPNHPTIPHLLTLTARSDAALRQLAGRFANHLDAAHPAHLPDICFSANTGRTLFAFRLALVAEHPAEMAGLLAAFGCGQRPPGVHFGHSPRRRTAVVEVEEGAYPRPQSSLVERRRMLEVLGGWFVEGSAAVEWGRLAGDGRMRRVSLPTYPFERQRYWMAPEQQPLPVHPTPAKVPQPPHTPRDRLAAYVQKQVMDVLKLHSAQTFEPERSLSDLGLDSLMLVELRDHFTRDLQVTLSPARLLRNPSIDELVEELSKHLREKAPAAQPQTLRDAPVQERAWLAHRLHRPKARLRLFCFHHLGGGASVFRQWADALPADVEVCPVQFPGREERIAEMPLTSFCAAIELLVQVLEPHLDRPFALYGHSMGSLVGFELAHRLGEHHGLQPEHLFVGGLWAPHLHAAKMAHQQASLSTLLEIPAALRTDAQFMAQLWPAVEADNHLCRSYSYQERARLLGCPLTVFGGLQDRVAGREELTAWNRHTNGIFRLQMFPGRHLFLNDSRDALLKVLARSLAPARSVY